MRPQPRSAAAPFWTQQTLLAVGLALLAVGVAVGAGLLTARADRLAGAVDVQRMLSAAYETRALDCLDQSLAKLDSPREAERSLNISGGITLCLVEAREYARIDEAALEACIRGLEVENLVAGDDGADGRRPAC